MEFRPAATESPSSGRSRPRGRMRVPAIVYADQALIEAMDGKVFEQLNNVATLRIEYSRCLRRARRALGIWTVFHRRRGCV